MNLDDPESVWTKIEEIYCEIRDDLCIQFEESDITIADIPNCDKCVYMKNARKRANARDRQQKKVWEAKVAFERAQTKLEQEETKMREIE